MDLRQLLKTDTDCIKQSIDGIVKICIESFIKKYSMTDLVLSTNKKKKIIGQIGVTVMIVRALKLVQQRNHQLRNIGTCRIRNTAESSVKMKRFHFEKSF